MKKENKQVEKKTEEKKMPEAKFRSGVLSATVWAHEVEGEYGKNQVFSFTIDRSYKDKDNEWQTTTSFRRQDIGAVRMLLDKVADFILLDEDEEEAEE